MYGTVNILLLSTGKQQNKFEEKQLTVLFVSILKDTEEKEQDPDP
jgi:hypothetical protein